MSTRWRRGARVPLGRAPEEAKYPAASARGDAPGGIAHRACGRGHQVAEVGGGVEGRGALRRCAHDLPGQRAARSVRLSAERRRERLGERTEQVTHGRHKAAHPTGDKVARARTDAVIARGVLPKLYASAGLSAESYLRRRLLILQNSAILQVFNLSSGAGCRYVQDGVRPMGRTRRATPSSHDRSAASFDARIGEWWRPQLSLDGYAVFHLAAERLARRRTRLVYGEERDLATAAAPHGIAAGVLLRTRRSTSAMCPVRQVPDATGTWAR